jgi:polar amino acid transport system substrate-binding protein
MFNFKINSSPALIRLVIITVFLVSLTDTVLAQTVEKSHAKTFNLVAAVYPPYNYLDEGVKGLNIDIVEAVFAAVDYQVKVEFLPFGRALQYAKHGTVDGITLWHSKHRTQWFQFSEPFTDSELIFYKRKSLKINYRTLSDITPFTVGTVQKYAYPESFANNVKIKKDQVLTDEKNIKKLILGRIDMALIDKRMAQFILRKNHPEQQHLFDSVGTLKNENYYLAISKNTSNYKQKLEAFNLGLAKIKENGILAKIIRKYE